jgi:beta-lactam-binding protein with PASTA domain
MKKMNTIIEIIKTKKFWIHFVTGSTSAIVFLWIFFQCMNLYTDHNQITTVPDFKGKSILELDKFIEDKEINYKIIDSLYLPDQQPGIVINQDPLVNIKVKKNRKIYLYVSSTVPPQIKMPKFIDRSLRQATSMIESYGLKMGKINFIDDPCVNCILEQLIDGVEIQPGMPVKKGSKIDLVVGKGEKDKDSLVISSANKQNEQPVKEILDENE